VSFWTSTLTRNVILVLLERSLLVVEFYSRTSDNFRLVSPCLCTVSPVAVNTHNLTDNTNVLGKYRLLELCSRKSQIMPNCLCVCLFVCVCVSVSDCMSSCMCGEGWVSVCMSVCLCVSVCREGWVSRGSYLTAINSECVAQLVYTATLVRADSLVFEYQKDSLSQFFAFEVSSALLCLCVSVCGLCVCVCLCVWSDCL